MSLAHDAGTRRTTEGNPMIRPDDATIDTDRVLAAWDEVLDAVKRRKIAAHAMLMQYAAAIDVRENDLALTLSVPVIAQMFSQGGNTDVLCAALAEQFGGTWRVTIEAPN
jgi:DNA polymerase-3 subunit gamma/tau